MITADTNTKIRREVKSIRKQVSALNSIYWQGLQLISDDQKKELTAELGRIIDTFDQQEVNSYRERNSGKMSMTILESDIVRAIGIERQRRLP